MLSDQDRIRYERNLLIPGFGEEGQVRLKEARVLIVGLGGLGSPAALYLAAAGVGTLGLLDSDKVELSNLQRQVIHSTMTLGKNKVESAVETLRGLNPGVETRPILVRLAGENAIPIIRDFDVVVEACDNYEAKYLVNDSCVRLGKPFATAGILALSGQALFVVPGKTPCLRCLVPDIPEGVPTTSEQGVLGAVPGILGSVEAMEVIRWVTGLWRAQPEGDGLLHSVDGDTMHLRTIQVHRRNECLCSGATGGDRNVG